jgi:short-subunit dehydrogenase
LKNPMSPVAGSPQRPPAAADAPLAVVTGASSGIGMAVARLLARRGCRTILVARRTQVLDTLAEELSGHAPCCAAPADLSDPAATSAIGHHILRRYGPVDILINNAGFGIYRDFARQTWGDHERLMAVNYRAPLMLTRAFLPGMLSHGRGHIINVSSMAARIGPWGHAGYAASKAALRAMTEVLAAEYNSRGVHVSCVFPGIIDTPYFRIGGLGPLFDRLKRHAITPERCASAIVGLLDRPRVWAYVPRHYRLLDLVAAVSPPLAHAIVARKSRALPATNGSSREQDNARLAR